MDPPSEPPKTPRNKFPYPPTPCEKTPPPRTTCDINTRDAQGPLYFEYRKQPPDFEVPPLKGGDFKERPTLEEWADKLGFKLPSGESVLSGRPDPSDLKSGAKLPPSIEEIDRLLKMGDGNPMSLTGRPPTSEPNSRSGAFLKSAEEMQKKIDKKDSKPSSENSKKSKVGLGAMLPPPLKAFGGLQKKQISKPSFEKSNKSKQEVGTMSHRLLKGAAHLQEMMDMANPEQAEEDRAKVFMDRLPHVQAASRCLQGQLEIHSDETWPLPPLPNDHNPFIVETNAIKIRAALENCKDFAVRTDRDSGKFEFLDAVAKSGKKRMVRQADQCPKIKLTSFEDEKKASETESSNAIANMMDEGLQEELKELEDEGMSEVPSTPKPLFHSHSPSLAPRASQISQGSNATASEDEDLVSASQGASSVDTAERERRRKFEEFSRDPRFRGIGPYGWPEYDGSQTPEPVDVSDANDSNPKWISRENATPNPHYHAVPYNMPTASSDDREMRDSSEIEAASAASEYIPATINPPSRELSALSVHDSEVGGTKSMIDEKLAVLNTQDKDKGRETSPRVGETTLDGPRIQEKGKGQATSSSVGGGSSYAPQTQKSGEGQQTFSSFHGTNTDNLKEGHSKMTGLSREKLDVAASLQNHAITYLDENQPKTKERNPPVPQPENMHNTLTEAICSYIPLEAKPILTLTLQRVDAPIPSPIDQRSILLKHFEVGLDGVKGLCQGTARIPEIPEVTAEREKRVGKLGTFKQGDGGFYRSLKSAQQKDQQYGKGYWYFFGVKFKQTSRERKLKRGGKWLLFGAPIEAVYHLDIKRSQENVAVMLGGGVDKSGTSIKPFEANFKRTRTLFSRGGIAPMDIWQGGEDWDDGVFKDIRAAMANNGLRVGFLYKDSQTFTPRPMGFSAAGTVQAEKKRKQAGPDMTEEETQAMEKSMKPKKLSEKDIGTILAMGVINDRAKQDPAAYSK